jgi:transposase
MDDNVFFDFFKFFGKKLNVTHLTLYDFSEKKVGSCEFSQIIFALAGKGTLYEKFGFKNEEFTEAINEMKNMKVGQFLERAFLANLNGELQKLGLTQESTIKETCTKILQSCEQNKIVNKQAYNTSFKN